MANLIKHLSHLLEQKGLTLTTAESCTGGLLAASLTALPGASRIFERGFITYSNASKTELLGVPADTIATHGAVSNETAQAMAEGALQHSTADLAISITGIAGPDGGTEAKPVGTVYIGYALKNGSSGALKHHFTGTREDIRSHSSHTAVQSLIAILEKDDE